MATLTRTVLFTDLTDYTDKVSRTDRTGLHKILSEHEQMVRPVVERYGGQVAKNIGDSFLCLFPSATDAVRAAMDIQEAARASEEIPIRLAMTTGDVEEIDGDAFGETVNIAARILEKTPGGEIWFGVGTRVCMNDAEIPWEGVGRFGLKGIPEEQKCYRVVPSYRAWLPHVIERAAAAKRLVRIRPAEPEPALPVDAVILFEGFDPGSRELKAAMRTLPVLDPGAQFLAAYTIATSDRKTWTDPGRGLVIGTPEAIDEALESIDTEPSEEDTGPLRALNLGETISIQKMRSSNLQLVISGLALPAVPFGDVVASYSYDLLPDGSWVSRSDEALLRVEVTPGGALLRSLSSCIVASGRLLDSGEPIPLTSRLDVSTPAGNVQFRPMMNGYCGVLLSEQGTRLGLQQGQTAEIGRQPNPPGLAFPVRRGQDSIRWCSGERAAQAQASGFTLDRVLAGRRQAAIQYTTTQIELRPLHQECPTFVLRENQLRRAEKPMALEIEDLIVAGTTVVALRPSM